jgi:hypothetical protein
MGKGFAVYMVFVFDFLNAENKITLIRKKKNIIMKSKQMVYVNAPFYMLDNDKLHLFCQTQHRFILIAPYMYDTCCSPFSGNQQTCQYKNHRKEDTMK